MKPSQSNFFGRRAAVLLWLVVNCLPGNVFGASAVLLGWSDSGLHETDGADVSVYSLQPPYSTLAAQLVLGGKLVTSSNGISLTYEAIADPSGSINTTSQGKGNFYHFAQAIYGQALAPDQGLAGFAMPGPTNTPQPMAFDPAQNRFVATGIPLTPFDDQGRKNPFPTMRLVARNSNGAILATAEVVLPVSDEMDCRACHASGSQVEARPASGWVWDCDPNRDYKLNVLRYHDDVRRGTPSYTNVLIQVGYNPAGLVATVEGGQPVLCIRCHASNALPGSGAAGMRPLTRLIHTKHAKVLDPHSGASLDDLTQSSACQLCHAGSERLYLRGIHGRLANPDGSAAITCQNCHGNLTALGDKARVGWADEPSCESCHVGTADHTAGTLRFTNVFSAPGTVRPAVDRTFAVQTNSLSSEPALYRTASDHGGLQCAACHGPAHGEWPSTQVNENLQSQQIQGHEGVLAGCAACHPTIPSTSNGGPHMLHPVGQSWVSQHTGPGRRPTACQACHGTDYRGTVLALMQSDQTLRGEDGLGSQLFWRGFQIGCYNCHGGPSGEGRGFRNNPPTVANTSTNLTSPGPVSFPLPGSDPNGDALLWQVVSGPSHGRVALIGSQATYYPDAGFFGQDSFSFAAWDGWTDSNLGTARLTVNPGACVLSAGAAVPTAALPGVLVAFHGSVREDNCADTVVYDWDFGDGSPHSAEANACHAYSVPGDFTWKLTVTGNGASQLVHGVVTISPTLGPVVLISITQVDGVLSVSWPTDSVGTSLEASSDPADPNGWQPVIDPLQTIGATFLYQTLVTPDPQFFRVRRVP